MIFQDWVGCERLMRSCLSGVVLVGEVLLEKMDWMEAAQDEKVGSTLYSSMAYHMSVHCGGSDQNWW